MLTGTIRMTPLSTRLAQAAAPLFSLPRRRGLFRLIGVAACGLLAAFLAGSAAGGDDAPSGAGLTPAAARMKADVTFLAADEQEGREPGTKGIEVSADYIANVFKKAGLKPAPGCRWILPAVLHLGRRAPEE